MLKHNSHLIHWPLAPPQDLRHLNPSAPAAMTITVHGMKMSTCTKRVLMTLEELEVKPFHLPA